jgi:hypothetical protein
MRFSAYRACEFFFGFAIIVSGKMMPDYNQVLQHPAFGKSRHMTTGGT